MIKLFLSVFSIIELANPFSNQMYLGLKVLQSEKRVNSTNVVT